MNRAARFLVLLVLTVLILGNVSAQEDDKPRVSVLTFRAEGVSDKDANTITKLFEVALINTGAYTVVEKEEREGIVEIQRESQGGCTDDACAVEIGRLLSARSIFLGSVSTLGTQIIVTIKLVDVEKGQSMGAQTESAGSLDEIPSRMQIIANKFAPGGGGGGQGALVFEDEQRTTTATRTGTQTTTETATVVFSSNPQGVRFKLYNLDGELLFDGKTPKGLPLRLSTYRVEAEDNEGLYFPFSEEFSINQSGRVRYEITMQPNFGGIAIYSEPPGADVLLNGIPVGTTPYIRDRMSAGEYEFVIQKDLYESERIKLQVEAGKTARQTAGLVASYVTLKLASIDDVKAKVYIDGEYKGALPYQGTLPFRDFEIRVVPEDSRYHEFSDVATVRSRGEIINRDIRFGGKFGNIWIDTSPFLEGRVVIDGKEMGVSPDLFTLLEGRHSVTVRGMQGGNLLSGTQEVYIAEGQDKSITITMVQDVYQDFVRETLARLEDLEALKESPGPGITEDHVAEVRKISAEIDGMPVSLPDLAGRAGVLEEDLTAAFTTAYLDRRIDEARGNIDYYEDRLRNVTRTRRGKFTGGLVSFLGALAAGGGAGYSYYLAEEAQERYDSAVYTSDAREVRGEIERYDMFTVIGASVGGLLGILTPIIWGNMPDRNAMEVQLSNSRNELARLSAMRATGSPDERFLQDVDRVIQTALEGGPAESSDQGGDEASMGSASVPMVTVIPAGKPAEFIMGADDIGDKAKSHRVQLTRAFEISPYEVTFGEYTAFCKATGRSGPDDGGNSSRPVSKVSWYDAVDYCNWLSERDGFTPCYTRKGDLVFCNFEADGYRLPTEAEWEFAAGGGFESRGYTYSGGNDLSAVAWCKDNAGEETHPVGQRTPNELGLYDMSGNVWEWVWDWYSTESHASSPYSDPLGPVEGEEKTEKGGSWYPDSIYMRPQNRAGYDPAKGNSDIGFRVARTTGGAR